MASATQHVRLDADTGLPVAAAITLARLGCGASTRGELIRDLAPVLATGAAGKARAEAALADLVRRDLANEERTGISATVRGQTEAQRYLGIATAETWATLRDQLLTGKALGIPLADHRRIKQLSRPDHLRIEIVAQAYGLKLPKRASAARVRAQLAVVALERAFGNSIGAELGHGEGLSAKASRLLAAQLLKAPRDPRTDQRLIGALAAEHVGAKTADPDLLRAHLIRRMCDEPAPAKTDVAKPAAPIEIKSPKPATPVLRAAEPSPPPPAAKPAAANRPDLTGFAREVKSTARRFADGWPGNRKAFICHVWSAIAQSHPAWGLSEIEFKAMLAEAHRTGHVVLANADLKDKKNIREFQASAIPYKNTVWHFIRVED